MGGGEVRVERRERESVSRSREEKFQERWWLMVQLRALCTTVPSKMRNLKNEAKFGQKFSQIVAKLQEFGLFAAFYHQIG